MKSLRQKKSVFKTFKILFSSFILFFYVSNAGAKDTNFKIAVLPDTQYYSMTYPKLFVSQTKWIANNYKSENIIFTVHLGDIVQNGLAVREWANAMNAMAYLDANPKTPYSIASGNHDVPNWYLKDNERFLNLSLFLKYFPVELQSLRSKTFKGYDKTKYSSYHIFEDDDGQKYLVLALDWRVSYPTLQWADEILTKYSDLPTIITTHELLDLDKSKKPFLTDNGEKLWKELISKHNQVFLAIGGHNYGAEKLVLKNDFENEVLLLLIDYQDQHKGGNGMMSFINFNKQENEIQINSFSPWVDSIPKHKRTKKDKLEAWGYNYKIDFKKRFKPIN